MCSSHGVHHTIGKDCIVSDEDRRLVEEYEEGMKAERATWGKLSKGEPFKFAPGELERGMQLREKIRQQERKKILAEVSDDPEGD